MLSARGLMSETPTVFAGIAVTRFDVFVLLYKNPAPKITTIITPNIQSLFIDESGAPEDRGEFGTAPES